MRLRIISRYWLRCRDCRSRRSRSPCSVSMSRPACCGRSALWRRASFRCRAARESFRPCCRGVRLIPVHRHREADRRRQSRVGELDTRGEASRPVGQRVVDVGTDLAQGRRVRHLLRGKGRSDAGPHGLGCDEEPRLRNYRLAVAVLKGSAASRMVSGFTLVCAAIAAFSCGIASGGGASVMAN